MKPFGCFLAMLLAGLAGVACAATPKVPAVYHVAANGHDAYCAKATAAISAVELEDAGLVAKNSIDVSATKALLLAKHTLFKDISERVYQLELKRKGSEPVRVIAVTTSYYGECPGDHVKTYVISNEVGQLPSLTYLPDAKSQK